MSRTVSTKLISSKCASLISDIYTERIAGLDLGDPSTYRALIELRLYHFPVYHTIPTEIKAKICAQNSPAYNLTQDYTKLTNLERETFYDDSSLFRITTRHEPCKICGTRRANINGVCYACQAKNSKEFRTLSKKYNASRRIRDYRINWTSPKKMLMACEIGCLNCGRHAKVSKEDFWLGAPIDFEDGVCSECAPDFRKGDIWNVAMSEFYHSPQVYYPACMVCGSNSFDYALWGMCESCYQEWQAKYYYLAHFIDIGVKYGAMAQLLIDPSPEWQSFVMENTTIKVHAKRLSNASEFVPLEIKDLPVRRAKEKIVYPNIQQILKELKNDSIHASES